MCYRPVATLSLEACSPGPAMMPLDDATWTGFDGWENPPAPRGVFNLDSGWTVEEEDGRRALAWHWPAKGWTGWERAVMTGAADWRDYRVTAVVRPIDADARPTEDNLAGGRALVGIAARMETLRRYYHFAVEGRRRLVLYRRNDDEWFPLAEQEITLPDGDLTLEMTLDGDGIRCRCDETATEFFVTDDTFRSGMTGVRAIGACRVAALTIAMRPTDERHNDRRRRLREAEEAEWGRDIPGAELIHTCDLDALGGVPQCADFARAGRFDLLVTGASTRALTVEGEELWALEEPVFGAVFSSGYVDGGRLIYALAGQRGGRERLTNWGATLDWAVQDELLVIRGTDGTVLARAKLPEFEPWVNRAALSPRGINLTGDGTDIIVREWRDDLGDGGVNLWAYTRDLRLLWSHRVRVPYGHNEAVQAFDVDGDGREEILAGGTLLSPDGKVLWEHDLGDEMLALGAGGHYDTVAIGNFAGDPDLDPVAFLIGSARGVYVVDGRTGRTRAVHRTGHAQDHHVARLRDDLPGLQVLSVTRWGNPGIQTLFAGDGSRLWSIQPDFAGQGSRPVQWDDRTLIWMNTSAAAQGLYDGHGRKVKDLPALRNLLTGVPRKDFQTFSAHLDTDPREMLCVAVGGMLYAFAPGEKVE